MLSLINPDKSKLSVKLETWKTFAKKFVANLIKDLVKFNDQDRR